MVKRPEMRRDGTSLFPRVRGSSESISRAAGAAGIPQERPKTMKEKENMKSWKIMFTVLSALVCVGLMPAAKAVEPAAPETAFPGGNTADGDGALAGLTGGFYNSAFGFLSLLSNGDASFNTGVGAGALLSNTANENTAVGAGTLISNTTGVRNTAVGTFALWLNTEGSDDNAVGDSALFNNVTGTFNNAHGHSALFSNVDGSQNNAVGDLAMESNTTGSANTAIGDDALRFNVDGSGNVAVGDEAGTGLGASVNNCIAINVPGAGDFAVFDNTCFIGSIFDQPVSDIGTQEAVFVDQFNVVGIAASSRRFKHDIQPMDKASEDILALKPVTFKYNADKYGRTQYGLVAEEVAQVNPDLVVQHKNGDISTVRYEQVNAMLLNEFLKEHKKVEEQQASIAQLKSEMQTMVAQLKEQAAQIQKVSAQVEVNKAAPQTVANK
jgi:hypothetical protein